MALVKPTLLARSESYIARLQRRNAIFQDNFTNFLNHETRKLLVIKTGSPLLSVISVHQILSNLEENLKSRYGGGAKSIFLSWGELVSHIGCSQVIPQFPNLVVLEFDKSAIDEQDMEVLTKIIGERLSMGPSCKKVVLVASEKGRLNNILQKLTSDKCGFLDLTKSLCEAASKGFLDEVESFVENGADIDQVDDDGNTAVHLAAQSGHKEIVLKLLKNGAKHLHNKEKDTPLHLAANHGHIDIVILLVQHGVDVNIRGNEGYSPLHYASRSGHKEVVQTLLQHGAKQLQSYSPYTPLHLAGCRGHGDIVTALLDYGADVNAEGLVGRTPLHEASWNGRDDVVRTLILYDANIQATDNGCRTALHQAVDNGQITVVNTLLEFGAEVDIKDHKGRTPLHLAALCGYLELVKLLIEFANANLNCKDNDGRTPLNMANDSLNYENTIGRLFLGRGWTWTSLDGAKLGQYTEVVEYLTSKGAK